MDDGTGFGSLETVIVFVGNVFLHSHFLWSLAVVSVLRGCPFVGGSECIFREDDGTDS